MAEPVFDLETQSLCEQFFKSSLDQKEIAIKLRDKFIAQGILKFDSTYTYVVEYSGLMKVITKYMGQALSTELETSQFDPTKKVSDHDLYFNLSSEKKITLRASENGWNASTIQLLFTAWKKVDKHIKASRKSIIDFMDLPGSPDPDKPVTKAKKAKSKQDVSNDIQKDEENASKKQKTALLCVEETNDYKNDDTDEDSQPKQNSQPLSELVGSIGEQHQRPVEKPTKKSKLVSLLLEAFPNLDEIGVFLCMDNNMLYMASDDFNVEVRSRFDQAETNSRILYHEL